MGRAILTARPATHHGCVITSGKYTVELAGTVKLIHVPALAAVRPLAFCAHTIKKYFLPNG